jgi:hypothetical protein
MTRAMANAAMKMHQEKVALPSDYLDEARRVLGKK